MFVKIVSDRFDGLSAVDKQDRIWNVLRRELGPDSESVSLLLAFGTDEI